MENTKISIIVPMYNEEPFIKRCVESLINQSYKDIEIIFVDDGSQDQSKVIIEEYQKKDSRIVLYSKNHSNRYDTRNYGIEKATGEFLMFCDADDLFRKDAVAHCANTLSKKENSDGVFFDHVVIDVENNIYNEERPHFLKKIPDYHICKDSRYLSFFRDVRFCCIRKKVITDNRIKFKNIPLYADLLFLAEYTVCAHSVNWLNKRIYVYYQKPAHIKSYNVSKDCLRIFGVAEMVKRIYELAGVWENVQNLYYFEFISQMAIFEDKKLQHAKVDIQKAYKKRLIKFVNQIPYVYLASICCYLDENIKVRVLSRHKDHMLEMSLCGLFYPKVVAAKIMSEIGRYLDNICRCVIPTYRAATNLRKRLIRMQEQISELLEEQEKRKAILKENGENEIEMCLNSTK